MNEQALLQLFRDRGCWPFQAQFAVDFLEEADSAHHLLVGPVGAGKLFATTALIGYMVSEGRASRILFLAPAPLLSMVQQKLAGVSVSADIVDRRRFRELVDSVTVGEAPWPRDVVSILSLDFAKQDDIAESLCEVPWDVVVIDEAHHLSGPRRAMLVKWLLSARAANRFLLMTATPMPSLAPLIEPKEDVEPLLPDIRLTNWYRDDLTDWEGKSLSRAGVQWEIVRYRRGADEGRFLRKFEDDIRELYRASGDNSFLVQILEQRASSSISAFEQTCQRLHHTLRASMDFTDFDVQMPEVDATEEEDSRPGAFLWRDRDRGLLIVTEWLQELENVVSDEKRDALIRVVSETIGTGSASGFRLCVVSSYVETLAYLRGAFVDAAMCETYLVTGELSFGERTEQIERYFRHGGILLGTDNAITEGVDLSPVTHVFHYDLPTNPNRLEQRHGRFDRFGRSEPCVMFVFQDDSEVLSCERGVVQSATKVEPRQSF